MKLADGMFHEIYNEIGTEYPNIEKEHFIVDIGSARIASKPSHFDVIVTLNLYGDIISDIAAEVSGSVGLAGSANIGDNFAMFEAIHGSAPDIAGKNIANPSGLLSSAVMMLVHLGQPDVATMVHNAWLTTIEQGSHTGDIYGNLSKEKLGTKEFADAVVARLGKKPTTLPAVQYKKTESGAAKKVTAHINSVKKELVGVDVFVAGDDTIDTIGKKLGGMVSGGLELKTLSCKGLKVWPGDVGEDMHLSDQLAARFLAAEGNTITHATIAALLDQAAQAGVDFTKTENLYNFDGKRGYSMGQGE